MSRGYYGSLGIGGARLGGNRLARNPASSLREIVRKKLKEESQLKELQRRKEEVAGMEAELSHYQ